MSPVGIEPTTNWLKANCSTTELRACSKSPQHTDRRPRCQPGNLPAAREIAGIIRAVIGSFFLAALLAIRLPTGVLLDPAAPAHVVGNFPLAIALAPGGDRVALLLNGWREQGVQIIDTQERAR